MTLFMVQSLISVRMVLMPFVIVCCERISHWWCRMIWFTYGFINSEKNARLQEQQNYTFPDDVVETRALFLFCDTAWSRRIVMWNACICIDAAGHVQVAEWHGLQTDTGWHASSWCRWSAGQHTGYTMHSLYNIGWPKNWHILYAL